MDFVEMIKSFFGSVTVQNILDVISTLGVGIVALLHKSSNAKFKTTDVNVAGVNKTVAKLNNQVSDLTTENKQLQKENKEIKELLNQVLAGVSDLGNIISTAFMGSKAISEESKLNMCKYVSHLKELGYDVKETVSAITEQAVEVVQELKEHIEKESEETIKKAEDTSQQSLDLYNQILDESDE